MAKSRTRKSRASNLDVRSDGSIKMLEKAIVNGPLTVVFVKLEGCGPCEQFNEEVWSPLTKLKNRSVNLARVDSQTFRKTSLAETPPKFYPTLLLVGKDGKPATFKDKDGSLTHAMPRNNTLSEDKKTLSELIQNPTIKSPETLMATLPGMATPPAMATQPIMENIPRNSPPRANMGKLLRNNTMNSRSLNSSVKNNTMNSRSLNNTMNKLKSPFNTPSQNLSTNSKPIMMPTQILASNPPDVGADLISSQSRNISQPRKEEQIVKGGKMLQALRSKASSIKALLRLREPRLTRKKHH